MLDLDLRKALAKVPTAKGGDADDGDNLDTLNPKGCCPRAGSSNNKWGSTKSSCTAS